VKFLVFFKLRPRSWGPIHCWSPNLKVGVEQSPPVPTVVAPMKMQSFVKFYHGENFAINFKENSNDYFVIVKFKYYIPIDSEQVGYTVKKY